MKTKAVIAAHIHKGQRIEIFGREGFYLVDNVTKRGQYIDIDLQGVFYPVCFPASQWVRVKL